MKIRHEDAVIVYIEMDGEYMYSPHSDQFCGYSETEEDSYSYENLIHMNEHIFSSRPLNLRVRNGTSTP